MSFSATMHPSEIRKGDVLLFESGVPPTISERLIARATHGPYVHTEIALGSMVGGHLLSVGAHPVGIVTRTIPSSEWNVRKSVAVHVGAKVEDTRVERAILWAKRQAKEKHEYGWFDILFQVAKQITGGRVRLWLSRQGAWDCSDFVTRYLWEMGLPLPDRFTNPPLITPNDLARYLLRAPYSPFDQGRTGGAKS